MINLHFGCFVYNLFKLLHFLLLVDFEVELSEFSLTLELKSFLAHFVFNLIDSDGLLVFKFLSLLIYLDFLFEDEGLLLCDLQTLLRLEDFKFGIFLSSHVFQRDISLERLFLKKILSVSSDLFSFLSRFLAEFSLKI